MEVTISLRPELVPIIESAAQRNGQAVPDYIAEVVEEAVTEPFDQKLADLIAEGLASGPAIEVTPEYWEKKRAALAQKLGR